MKLPMGPLPNYFFVFVCFRYCSDIPKQYKRILGPGHRNRVVYPPERMQEALRSFSIGIWCTEKNSARSCETEASCLIWWTNRVSTYGREGYGIALLGDCGFPLDVLDVTMLVKQYLTV